MTGPHFSLIVSLLSITWAVYSFALNRRQKQSEDLKADIFRTISMAREQQEKALHDTKLAINTLQFEIGKLRETLVQASTKSEVVADSIKEDIERIEKNLERQQSRLENFGRVIVKD